MFEIHVTIKSNEIEQFKTDCIKYGCKPLLIELQTNSLNYQQLMTSQKFNHKNWDVEIENTKNFFSTKYPIQRIKVEVNPYAYQNIAIKYYETHFRLLVNTTNKYKVDMLIQQHKFHKSKNIFKQLNNTEAYQMATYRTYDINLQNFEQIINDFKYELTMSSIVFDKVEVEACVIDTNDGLDNKWLS